MTSKNISSVSIVLVVCFAAIVIAQGQNNQKSEGVGNRLSINQVKDYRKMSRVNEQPMDMVEQTKMMCARPEGSYGPHYDPGVVYYINDVAQRGLLAYARKKVFPVGSIIVKEKQERRTEDSVQIITVMKKVLSGNGEDSWEYKMYDTKKWSEIDPSQQGPVAGRKTCLDCHRRYLNNDYVSDKGIALLMKK